MPGLAEAREAKAALLKAGCLGASVTGSGSGTFGIAADRQSAQEVSLELRKRWPRVHVTRTLQAGEGMAISNLPEIHE
jgi:4-diphosphocytidyl-2C-methyl-D-erythritol kinase